MALPVHMRIHSLEEGMFIQSISESLKACASHQHLKDKQRGDVLAQTTKGSVFL